MNELALAFLYLSLGALACSAAQVRVPDATPPRASQAGGGGLVGTRLCPLAACPALRLIAALLGGPRRRRRRLACAHPTS